MQTPFREAVSIYIATLAVDDKARKRLAKRWGRIPTELKIGQYVEYFKQTPFQLGLSDKNDYALLARSMEALNIYRAGEQAAKDLERVTPEQAALLIPLQKALKKR